MKTKLTPLMRQYMGFKSAHQDKILFFRMGDFFEIFGEDAQTVAPILGITLTVRNKKAGDQTSMCGFPHYSAGPHINKLLEKGFKVAVCDQVEETSLSKGLVKREVTRILSPGMVYDPQSLEARASNYLCALDERSISFMEGSTGECFYYLVSEVSSQKKLFKILKPVETLNSPTWEVLKKSLGPGEWGTVTCFEGESLGDQSLPHSARSLLGYASFMQGEIFLKTLKKFERRGSDIRLQMSNETLEHLEIFESYRGEKQGSLFSVLDGCQTPSGSRLLKHWLLFPLGEKAGIDQRQKEVNYWVTRWGDLKALRKSLFQVGDLERRLSKVAQTHCHPRDLLTLASSLESACGLVDRRPYVEWNSDFKESVTQIYQTLLNSFVEEIPTNYREGGFLKKGLQPELDQWLERRAFDEKKIRDLENLERERTGIGSLKIRYNQIFGYYIEVTHTHQSKVPKGRYQRKQTLTHGERYTTEELNLLEQRVLESQSRCSEKELEIFENYKKQILSSMEFLLQLAQSCNLLDVYTTLAWKAVECNWVCPMVDFGLGLKLEGSRHPVVEGSVSETFVANDLWLDRGQCILLTGPNMAGKSTLMRQVALTALMAQVGSFVPARKAQLPILDQIFTRIGASDFLTEGLSTFMVEMKETATMLNEATSHSLVILDEVGRGTSTYDGLSLAQSVLEYFLKKKKPYTFFATHYHELVGLEKFYPKQLRNFHMGVRESEQGIIFLYHLLKGPAHKSYGIHVARRAGFPPEVVEQAELLLRAFENRGERKRVEKSVSWKKGPSSSSSQLNLW